MKLRALKFACWTLRRLTGLQIYCAELRDGWYIVTHEQVWSVEGKHDAPQD